MLPQDARGLGAGGRKITQPIACSFPCIYYSCSRSRNHPSNSSTGFFAMFHAAQYCGKAGQYLQFPSRIVSTTVYQHSCAVPTVATETGKKDTRSGICRDGGVGARQLAAQGGGSRLLPHTPLTAQGPSKRHSPVGRVLRLDGSVLAEKYPQKMSQLMRYQITIVRAHKSFGGSGWLIYDTSRKAASIKSLNWGEVDFTLYNETVVSSRPQAPMQEYSHELALYRRDSTGYRERGGHQTKQICQPYNSKFGNKCRFTPCKFSHICLECKGLHPLMSCRHTRPPPPKIPRTDSFRDYRDKKN